MLYSDILTRRARNKDLHSETNVYVLCCLFAVGLLHSDMHTGMHVYRNLHAILQVSRLIRKDDQYLQKHLCRHANYRMACISVYIT